jgi:glycolate oxidase iron-sulfur subunit
MPDSPGRGDFAALDNCVHCGFCLSACPTYLATGDENASPRGRIVLMRALERGELASSDPALREHLDSCLGCRGCEPACPSGVEYGRGLAAAREALARANGIPWRARLVLGAFRRAWAWRAGFAVARWLRASGLAARLASDRRAGFLFAMLEATRPARDRVRPAAEPVPADGPTVALFRGCVMDALFGHVHQATRRTLQANGYRVVDPPGQVCCGALHEHAGDRAGATELARANLAALAGRADYVAVDSAGCGAVLKDMGRLLEGDAARALAATVRDVTELLAARGPRPGAPIALQACYDPPCHLQHAQRVHAEVLTVLAAVPALDVRLLPGAERCCGAAGIYGALHPAMSRAVLADKLAGLRGAEPRPAVVLTGNPGCLMQIGAGLRADGLSIPVAHPIELLDRSYALAGYYGRPRSSRSARPRRPDRFHRGGGGGH